MKNDWLGLRLSNKEEAKIPQLLRQRYEGLARQADQVDSNDFLPGEHDDLGRLRLTMAEFFRVNGSSTQLRGVTPDIRFPAASDSGKYGERALDNPLPWAKIEPVSHTQGSLENSME